MHNDEEEIEEDDDEKDDAVKQERPFSHLSALLLSARVCSGMVRPRKCAFPKETAAASAAGMPRENRKSAARGHREEKQRNTGGQVFIMSKVQCMFCLETCTTEGGGGEKGGSANFRTKHTDP